MSIEKKNSKYTPFEIFLADMPEQVWKAVFDDGVRQHRATQSFWSMFYKMIQNSAIKNRTAYRFSLF